MMDYTIRRAGQDDLPAVIGITNHYIRHSSCIMKERDEQMEERSIWLTENGDRYPLFVAVKGDEVVGWGGLSPHSERTAYRYTVHDAVYVRQDLRGQGIGSCLLDRLISAAKELGYRSVIAVVVSDHQASIDLHHRHGFRDAGCLRQVGYKFGKWIDVMNMQLML